MNGSERFTIVHGVHLHSLSCLTFAIDLPLCVAPLGQDATPKGGASAATKIAALFEKFGIRQGDGFCSQRLGATARETFNTRELDKLDIEAAKLAEPRHARLSNITPFPQNTRD